jgi:type III secretion system YscQ/HrcQ family protein
VPCRLRICLLSQVLAPDQLRSIVLHSAVVAGNHHQGRIPLRLLSACGRYAASASLEGDQVTVEGSLTRVASETFVHTRGLTMQTPQDPSNDATNEKQAVEVGDIPVELSFEIGSLCVPMNELETSLQKGYTFSLNHELRTDGVLVRANGAVIAKGELLKIGDLLAVRITGIESHGRR